MKRCSCCNIIYKLSEFFPTKRDSEGNIKYYGSWCKSCRKSDYKRKTTKSERKLSKVDTENQTKECLICLRCLPFEDFTKSQKGSGGRAAYCRVCMKEKYYDKEYSKEQSRRYRTENKNYWRALHRVHQFNRRSKIKATDDGTVTKEFIEAIYNSEFCYWCGKSIPEEDRTLEHIIELFEGGSHSASNITMACFSCNSSRLNKGVKPNGSIS